MTFKYAAFDLEITKQISGDFNQWKNHRPLGISCAGLLFEGEEPRLYYSRNEEGEIQSQMNKTDLGDLLKTMREAVQEGWTIVSWSGFSFDFDILAEESGEWEICRELALNHIDMMFHFVCLQGYPLGLDTAASGLGLGGKMDGVSGADAPRLWAEGEYETVLAYLAQDVVTTLEVAKTVEQLGYISWISRKGNPQRVRLSSGWLPVNGANDLPLPDTSWMSNPLSREGFYQWTIRNQY